MDDEKKGCPKPASINGQPSKYTENTFITAWTLDQHTAIVEELIKHGCTYIKGRDEYSLLKQVIRADEKIPNLTQVSNLRKTTDTSNPDGSRPKRGGVNSAICTARSTNDTLAVGDTDTPQTCVNPSVVRRPFLAPLDIQKAGSIADVIPSFRAIQSSEVVLNFGFDTEFQDFREDKNDKSRRILSLQMSLAFGNFLIRYFFLVDPRYQTVKAESGGMIPLKFCLSDLLEDLQKNYFPDIPKVLRSKIVYKERLLTSGKSIRVIDYHAMRYDTIPICIVCHTGKADISAFRRSKYDIDVLRKLSEIQGGWMSCENIYLTAPDKGRNYYWLCRLTVRDTLGLSPADNKSLKALGLVIHRDKIELPNGVIEHMADFAVRHPVDFFNYAVNDADIVVEFVSELFLRNRAIPITLSAGAASAMYASIKRYFGVKSKSEYDRVYRGLEMLDDGIMPSKEECLKFLKATRYVPIRDNPDARLVSEFYEEAYTGGFNASFRVGWFSEKTTDYDLQNAYPTAMSCILDIDWSKYVRDFPREYTLSWQDIPSPLLPSVAVGDFDFPNDCYCPNIPVSVPGGMKIYPLHGRHTYMTGADMYLALRLGAKIKVFRGFSCIVKMLDDGSPSKCLAYAVSSLVQDRMRAKKLYQNPLIEKSLKAMVNSCYGKTSQNVSPKTRYNARILGRQPAEPSTVTSPYHASYTTALVRCMVIGSINQLHRMGYKVYSATTDGLITNAPVDVVRALDAYGFRDVFQQGRYELNQSQAPIPANEIWEPKHTNDQLLNLTTRGNVATNDGGVLAHNSYITGKAKGSLEDREEFIEKSLMRNSRMSCPTKYWTEFSDIVERRRDFHVGEVIRKLSMNFDYKRMPLTESAEDKAVHYVNSKGISFDTELAEFETIPFDDSEQFLNYRKSLKTEDCVKLKKDLARVRAKASIKKGYVGKNLEKKILMSIIMGYRAGIYKIPCLDGLKQADAVKAVNSWHIGSITIADWKNCSRSSRQENMLPRFSVENTLNKILALSDQPDNLVSTKEV